MKVYIAGPYKGGGTWGENLNNAISAAEEVYNMGHTPFIPHTHTALWDLVYQKDSDSWLGIDFEWLDVCDAIIRLDGYSEGADKEVEYAKNNGILVYYGVDEFKEGRGI